MEGDQLNSFTSPHPLSTIFLYSTHFFNSASDAAASSEILYPPIRQHKVMYHKTFKKHKFHVISHSEMTYDEPTHLGSVLESNKILQNRNHTQPCQQKLYFYPSFPTWWHPYLLVSCYPKPLYPEQLLCRNKTIITNTMKHFSTCQPSWFTRHRSAVWVCLGPHIIYLFYWHMQSHKSTPAHTNVTHT